MATREAALEQQVQRLVRRVNVSVIRDYGVVVAFVALFVTLSLASNVFFTWANMKNLAFQTAPLGIIAAGGTLVFIGGGFDLSVAAVAGFAAIISGKIFLQTGIGVWGSLILGAPAKVARELSDDDVAGIERAAASYVERAPHFRDHLVRVD